MKETICLFSKNPSLTFSVLSPRKLIFYNSGRITYNYRIRWNIFRHNSASTNNGTLSNLYSS